VGAQNLTLNSSVSGQTLSFNGTLAPANNPYVNGTLQQVPATTNVIPNVSSITNGAGSQLISDGPRTRFAQAIGYAAAMPGSVHTLVTVVAFDHVASINDSDGVAYLPDSFSMVASVGADSTFIERVRLTSTTLVLGTPVSFNLHLYADGSVQSDGHGFQNSINVYFPNVLTGAPAWGHCTQFDCTGDNVVNAKIGDIMTFGAEIRLAASVAIDSAVLANDDPRFWTNDASGHETIDASNTGGEWVSDFTPGLIFASSSGFDYTANPAVAPVPEPGTAGLLFAGLGLTVAWARRRNACVGRASHQS
jgi:hypothetical protein